MTLPPLTADGLLPIASSLLFAGAIAVTVLGALAAALSRRLVRSLSGLVMTLLGVGGLYYFLGNVFLALMQVLIYIGAVCVTIMFALMLADPNDEGKFPARSLAMRGVALLAAGGLAFGLFALLRRALWMPAPEHHGVMTTQALGRALLTQYGFAFELISVVLLLAILGALVVAHSGRGGRS